MRSKATLYLMEQLVMVLVFALAAAVCLRLFVGAQNTAEETSRRDGAVIAAQNAAELLKSGASVAQTEKSGGMYELKIHVFPEEYVGMEQVEITVFYEQTQLYSLNVGYREVGE